MQISTISPVQNQVIAAIAGGATMKSAAEAGNVHRNTLAYWRQTSPAFRQALSLAQHEKAMDVREQAANHVGEAFAAIRSILTGDNFPAEARLKAARMIIEQASVPPPCHPTPETVHSFAQEQARNAQCACGSGFKFKRCCLNNPRRYATVASAILPPSEHGDRDERSGLPFPPSERVLVESGKIGD